MRIPAEEALRRNIPRWLNALQALAIKRGVPVRRRWEPGWTMDGSRATMLIFAATVTDQELIEARNIGPKGLAWIRSVMPYQGIDALRLDSV